MSTDAGTGGHVPRGEANRPAPTLNGAPRGVPIACGPAAPTAEDLAIVATFERWLAGDRTEWDDRGLPWIDTSNPYALCGCGHMWMAHDIEEYTGDGSETCCVVGCPQTGCPGRRQAVTHVQRKRHPVSVVIEYHAHQPVARKIGTESVWGCDYVYLDGAPCPDFVAGRVGVPINWSGSRTMTREAVETHSGEGTAKKIEAYRDANDFARAPDWWQAVDAALDICRGKP